MTPIVVGIIVLSAIFALPSLMSRLADSFHAKRGITDADYVIMRAHPSLSADLKADFRDAGWDFATDFERDGKYYHRFEKRSSVSKSLSDILLAKDAMERTSNRKAGSEHIIAFVDYGKNGVSSV